MAASGYSDGNDPNREGVIREQAVNWLLRQRDGDMNADEWGAFADWLAMDESHGPVFDELVAADASLEGLAASLRNREEPVPVPHANDNILRRFAPIWGGAVAAALIGVLLWLRSADVPEFRHLETAPGERRVVALQDGLVMTLNGATEVDVGVGEATVRFVRGEAAFEITTRRPSPLRVEAGGLILRDHGTVFNVILDERSVRVAVAEGAVEVDSGTGTLLLEAGQQFERPLDGGTPIRRPIENRAVLSWRDGRLEFENTPVTQAAADVERNLGIRLAISDRLAGEQLTGSIVISGDDEQVLSNLALLLGGRLSGEGDDWRIE